MIDSLSAVTEREDTPRVADLRRRVRAAMERSPIAWTSPERIDPRHMAEPLPVRKARAMALKLGAIYALMREAGLRAVALLPYNEASAAKYEWLDRPYTIVAERQSPSRLEEILATARRAGLEAELG